MSIFHFSRKILSINLCEVFGLSRRLSSQAISVFSGDCSVPIVSEIVVRRSVNKSVKMGDEEGENFLF